MGQQGLCFRVVEVSGVSWCMGPLAELNKGAFFWLGLGASLTHLEVKPSASEGDSGGMGGSSEGRKSSGSGAALESKSSCHWALQRPEPGTLMPTSPGRRMLGAQG